jgi:hypothetical protein
VNTVGSIDLPRRCLVGAAVLIAMRDGRQNNLRFHDSLLP